MALQEHEHVLLLEHLYGLLDEPEASRIRDLVAADPVWREAFTEAQQTQKLFGKAAQIDVAIPEFKAPGQQTPSIPAVTPVQASEAPTLPFHPPVGRRSWGRYVAMAAAACLLIGAGGLTVAYQGGLQHHETQLSQIDAELRAIDNQIANLQKEQRAELARIPDQVASRFVHLHVSGPTEYQRDAPLPVRVRTSNIRGEALPAQVTAVLRANDKEIARQEIQSNGDAMVELPAGLPIGAPGTELEVEARTENGSARTLESLTVGTPGHATHLAINKSSLQTGEILFFRTLTLDRFSMKPADQGVPLHYTLVDAKGAAVSELRGETSVGGITGGEIALAGDLPSGPYTLRVANSKGEQVAARSLSINRPESPRIVLNNQLRAGQDAKANIAAPQYTKGSLNLTAVDAQRPANNSAPPAVSIPFNMDRDGRAAVQFRMPNIEGAALLKAEFENGAKKDSVQQLLPVTGSKLQVDFFPESGKLIAEIPNRVYFRVRTSLGEPVAPEGHVILLSSKDVVFDSERDQGIGVFTFTPRLEETYTLRVTSPQGTVEDRKPFAKLLLEPNGVAMEIPNAIAAEGEPIEVELHNTGFDRRLLLVATCRDRVVGEQFVDVSRGPTRLALPVISETRGVVRTTLYAVDNEDLQRVAERLVYRIPQQRLQLSAEHDKKVYRPGEQVKLTLKAMDEEGRKANAWLTTVVIDENEIGPIEQVAAGLESYFYLFAELGPPLGVEQALLNFADGEETREALDLYLGTRNWKATQAEQRDTVAQVGKDRGRDAAKAERRPLVFSKENRDRHQLAAELLVQARHDVEARIAHERLILEDDRTLVEQNYNTAALALADFRSLPLHYASLAAAIATVVLFLVGSLALIAGLLMLAMRRRGTLAFAGACACLFVCLVLYGAAGYLPQVNDTLVKASAAPAWQEANDEPIVRLDAWARAELPVGRFAAPPSASTAPAPSAALATNMDANRGNILFDYLAANTQQPGFGGQRNELERAKTTAAVQTPELQQRFQESIAKQRGGGLGSGIMAPASKKIDHPNDQLTARRLAEARAYNHRSDKPADLQDTVLWKPVITTPQGSAELSFDLSHRLTNYRVLTYGNDASGRLGFDQHTLEVRAKD